MTCICREETSCLCRFLQEKQQPGKKKKAKDKNFIPVVRIDHQLWEAICLWGTVAALTLYVPCKGQHFLFFCFTPCMHKSKLLAIFMFEVGNTTHQKLHLTCIIIEYIDFNSKIPIRRCQMWMVLNFYGLVLRYKCFHLFQHQQCDLSWFEIIIWHIQITFSFASMQWN